MWKSYYTGFNRLHRLKSFDDLLFLSPGMYLFVTYQNQWKAYQYLHLFTLFCKIVLFFTHISLFMLIVKRWPSQYMPGTPESNKEDLGDSPMLYIRHFLNDWIKTPLGWSNIKWWSFMAEVHMQQYTETLKQKKWR